MDELKQLATSLQSTKATERRTALGKLQQFVERQRKNGTLAQIERTKWSKLLSSILLPTLEDEISHQMKNKTKNMRKYVTEPLKIVVKCLVECLDDESENGDVIDNSTGQNLLTGKAIELLIDHLTQNLEDVNKRTYFTGDYCEILRSIMQNRVYSMKLSSKAITSLLQQLMSLITDEKHGVPQSESKQISQTVESIMTKYPNDLLDSCSDIISLFRSYFEARGDTGFESTHIGVITALNSYLLRYGHNFIYTLRDFGNSVGEQLCTIWQNTKSDPLRVEICTFFRILVRARLSTHEDSFCNRETFGALFQMIKFGLNEKRLFSYSSKNISDRQEALQRENLRIFFDLAADIFYEVIRKEGTRSEEQEEQSEPKRRKTVQASDQLLDKIGQYQAMNENITVHWQTLLLFLIRKYGDQLPVGLLYSAMTPVRSCLESATPTLFLTTLQVVEELAFQYKAETCPSDVLSIWKEAIFPMLCKFIATEATGTTSLSMRAISAILLHIDPSLAVHGDITKLESSIYFNEYQYCNESSVSLAVIILQLQQNQDNAHFIERDVLIDWIFKFLRFPKASQTLPRPELLSQCLVNLTRTTGYVPLSGSGDISDKLQELQMDTFEFLSKPFDAYGLARKIHQQTKVYDQLISTEALPYIEPRLLTILKSSLQQTVEYLSSKEQSLDSRVEDVLYLALTLLNLLQYWPHYNMDDELRSILQDNIHRLISFASEKIRSTPPSTDSWRSHIHHWSGILHFFKEGNNFVNLGRLTAAFNILQNVLVDYVQSLLETDFTDSQHSTNNKVSNSDMDDNDMMMLDSEDLDSASTSIIFQSSTSLKNYEMIIPTIKVLSLIGQTSVTSAESVYALVEKKLLNLKLSTRMRFTLLYYCSSMGAFKVCVSVLSAMPTAVQDVRSFAFILDILRAIGTSISSSCNTLNQNDEYKTVVERVNKILVNMDRLREQDKLSQEARMAFAKCLCPFVVMDNFDELVESLISLQSDPSYLVRIYAAEAISLLFDNSNLSISKVYGDAWREYLDPAINLNKTDPDDLSSRTAILAMAYFGLGNEQVEQEVIFNLILCNSKSQFREHKFAEDTLKYMAQKLKYEGLVEYLEDNINFVMYRWLLHNSRLDNLPVRLFNKSSLAAFLHEYGASVLPYVVVQRDSDLLNRIAKTFDSKKTARDIVVSYFSSIFAYCFLLYFKDAGEGKQIIESFLRELLGSDLSRLLMHEMDNILVDMLAHLSSNDACDLPLFPENIIVRGFEKMAKDSKHDSILAFLREKKGRIYHILYNIHEKMSSTNRNSVRRDCIRCLNMIIVFLGPHGVSLTSTLRYLIHIVLQITQVTNMCELACDLLLNVLHMIKDNVEGVSEFGRNLQRIVNAMVALLGPLIQAKNGFANVKLEQNSLSQDPEITRVKATKPYLVLHECFVSCPALQQFLPNLDPIELNHPALNDLHRAFRSHRGNLSFVDEVKLFNKKNGSEGLAQILHVLKNNKDSIIKQLDSLGQETSTLTSKLVNICRGYHNSQAKLKAGECLGVLGLSVPFFECQDIGTNTEYQFDIVSVDTWTAPNILNDAKKKILELLNNYLVDTEVHVVRVASETLRRILNTKTGQDAYLRLADSTKLQLQPFSTHLEATPRPYSGAYIRFLSKFKYLQEYAPLSEALFQTVGRSHQRWVMNVTHSLIQQYVEDEVLKMCADICLCKSEFAEQVFPLIIFDMSKSKHQKTHLAQLSPLIEKHIVLDINCNPRTIRMLLSTLHLLLRSTLEIIKASTVIAIKDQKYKYWLNLPYLKVAEAALRAGAVHTSLMYTEMDFEEDQVLQKLPATLCFEEDSPNQQDLLLRAYRHVNEPDGIYGVNRNYGLNSVILKAEHEGDWQQALGSYDVAIRHHLKDNEKFYSGMISSLRHLGFDRTLETVLQGIANPVIKSRVEIQEQLYENAWRSCTWDASWNITSKRVLFHHSVFECLKAFNDGNVRQFWKLHELARTNVVQEMSSSTDLFANLSKLQMLEEIEDAWKMRWGTSDRHDTMIFKQPYTSSLNDNTPLNKWLGTKHARLSEHSFKYTEPLLALRTVLLKTFGRNDLIPLHLVSIIKLARKESQFSFATGLVRSLSSSSDHKVNAPLWLPEEAKILWAKGEKDTGIHLAQFLLNQLKQQYGSSNISLLGQVNRMIGRWLTQTQSESSDIVEQYLIEGVQKMADKCKAFYSLAKYYDTLHTNILRKLESEEYKMRQEINRANRRELENAIKQLQQQKRGTAFEDMKRFCSNLQRSINQDEEDDRKMGTENLKYLLHTMLNLIEAGRYGDKYDIPIVFRLCSLWFSNSANDEVNKVVATLVSTQESGKAQFQTYKFIPLVYQIASRMSNSKSTFHTVVSRLMLRIALDHPHHSLFQILALKNGDRISKDDKTPDLHSADPSRIQMANLVFNEVKKKHSELITQMEALSEAYMELAFLTLDKKQQQLPQIKMLNTMKIRKLKNLTQVPVPTIELPYQPNGSYRPVDGEANLHTGEFPYIESFEENISLAGGVNLPKIIKCIGSDGKRYRQLVKGRDDLRQDAVMEQIFSLVNTLLVSDKQTRKRNLRIRTYKIIPLSPTSGILGWVENTVPLAHYLVGPNANRDPKGGAHYRYRPQDMSYVDCRKQIIAVVKENEARKIQVFKEVMKRFRPVFHHFFTENFANPTDWFSKRLAYTRSVASNSIVGYIVGLGDRHAHNILIDMKSAECVHIDLGVAFDQGQLLPIPERVPFRLTRDIVDGFGVTGVEGVFRRCAEHTMSVLRNNSELLSLIVEVFMHDPLYRWSLSPMHKLRLQRDKDEEDDDPNKSRMLALFPHLNQQKATGPTNEAQRSLMRLREKLKGYEEGEYLSVKGQINKLITTATNVDLWGTMFNGWGAHM